ncbi:MAG: hypothetical protein LUK37_09320 [Clostridia bacterium]|nr:hypothetical protein [Clostridia bacterium]
MSYKDIANDEDFIQPVMDFVSREKEIRRQLEKVIPAYKQKAIFAAVKLSQILE